jgi:spore photoproduct lyase
MRFERIFVADGAENYPLAAALLKRLAEAEKVSITDLQEVADLDYEEAKRSLVLMVRKGRAVKEFPPAPRNPEGFLRGPERASPSIQVGRESVYPSGPSCKACKEFYIFFAQGCPYDCHYCFLQDYNQSPAPILFVNTSDMLRQIEETIVEFRQNMPYLHAGELADALVFDPLTDFSKSLIDLFNNYPEATLELRTKSTQVENLLSLPHKQNIIPSWTFSPQKIVRLYEAGTPSLKLRLKAARCCQDAGYPIGLRLDPIIRISGWQKAYEEMIEEILSELALERIESAVLGCFRYTKALEHRIRKRFPEERLLLDEFVLCGDGKYRYFKPLRLEMYGHIIASIRKRAPKLPISLCMETPEVQRRLFSHLQPRVAVSP